MRVAGLVLAGAGATLVLRSALLLLGRGRARRGPQPALVIAGPYLRVRNPVFAGILLALAGVALARRSWLFAAAAALAAAALQAWVVRIEEPALGRRFGRAYDAYRRAVPRWWPRRTPTGRR